MVRVDHPHTYQSIVVCGGSGPGIEWCRLNQGLDQWKLDSYRLRNVEGRNTSSLPVEGLTVPHATDETESTKTEMHYVQDLSTRLSIKIRGLVATSFVGSQSGGSVPSSQLRQTFAPRIPVSLEGKTRSLSIRRSRSLFLGNMPETACRMI